MVTVVMPYTCNKQNLIEDTLVSVQRQTLQQYEVLIINDGCNEPASLSLLNRITATDPRLILIRLEEQQGLPRARNIGYTRARARYIFQLDSDDLLEPTTLEKLFWFLETHPQYGFAKGYNIGFGAREYTWPHAFDAVDIFLTENRATATAMVRKSTHMSVGGNTEGDTTGNEDWDYWLKCADAGFWGGTVPEFMDWYRRRESHAGDWTSWQDPKLAVRRFQERYPKLYGGQLPRPAPPPTGADSDCGRRDRRCGGECGGARGRFGVLNPVPRVAGRQRAMLVVQWSGDHVRDMAHLHLLDMLMGSNSVGAHSATAALCCHPTGAPHRTRPWHRSISARRRFSHSRISCRTAWSTRALLAI